MKLTLAIYPLSLTLLYSHFVSPVQAGSANQSGLFRILSADTKKLGRRWMLNGPLGAEIIQIRLFIGNYTFLYVGIQLRHP